MSLYTAQEIMDIIPHRYPFLLIDTIEELDPGVRALGRKCVSVNEPFFQGHFPGNPVMPGVLLIEALAQVGAVAMLAQPDFKGRTAYFAGIDKARFRQKVVPGDVLLLETEIIKVKGPIGVGRAVAKVGDKVAAQAELTFSIG
jgi:beta-hydroxyacyl-[acyl carrier protein] dehydratase FabZ